MAQSGQRKCLCCGLFFESDHRNLTRQRYCSATACRHASKVASQAAWLARPQNRERWLDTHPYSAQQIFQRLGQAGFEGGISIVKDYVHRIRPRHQEAFLKLDFAAGECAQVDWGEWGTIGVGSTRRRLSFFVMVLCYRLVASGLPHRAARRRGRRARRPPRADQPDARPEPVPPGLHAYAHGVAKPTKVTSGGVTGIGTNFGPRLRKLLAPHFVDDLARIHTFDHEQASLGSFSRPEVGSPESAQLRRWPARPRPSRLLLSACANDDIARTPQLCSAQLQHDFCIWTGGHLIEPKEQNTQQSPGFGRSKARQFSHS